MYKYTKIQGPRFQSNYIRDQKRRRCQRSFHVISILAENKSHTHHKTYLHTKFTTPNHRSFANLDSYFFSTTQFQAIEFVDRHVSESSKFNLSYAFFAKHAWLRSRNDSTTHFPRSLQGTPGTMSPLLCPKYDENALQITQARLIILTSRFSFVSSGIQRPGNAVLFFSREERLFSLSSSIEVPVSENKSTRPCSVKLYSKAGVLWRTNHNSSNMESLIRETVKQVLECDFLPSPPHIS